MNRQQRPMHRFASLVLVASVTLGLTTGVPDARGAASRRAAQDAAIPRQRRLAPLEQGSAARQSADEFGAAIVRLGDLDGNGVSDVAVGAPGAGTGGAIWVLFLRADGAPLRAQRIEIGQAGFAGNSPAHARFGSSLACLGDLDGDGNLELAVGAPGSPNAHGDREAGGSGWVWILSLNPQGLVVGQRQLQTAASANLLPTSSVLQPAQSPDSRPAPAEPLERALDASDYRPQLARDFDGFGHSLAAPGDLNGDGWTDLVVGAPFDDDGGSDRGALWIFQLDSEAQVLSQQKISDTQGFFSGQLRDGDQFGYALASAGDLDRDGRPELAIGAPGADAADGPSQGAAWILFLGKRGGVRRSRRIEVPQHGDASGAPGLRFGASICSLGDLNQDGTPDLALGAPGAGPEQAGDLWLVLLREDGSVLAHQTLGVQDPAFVQGLQPGAGLGRALTRLDDLDGNGIADLMISATFDEGAGPRAGALWNVLTESCFAASVSVREGTGRNPRTLSARELPRRGNPWWASLDCSEEGPGIASLLGRTRAASGIMTEAGEALVDLSPASFVFLLQRSHRGGSVEFEIDMPLDAASCNMALFVQGLCSSAGSARFSNALDLIIGR